MSKCWIIGPIAWDLPYRIPNMPMSGQFAQAVRLPGRPGGTGANVARALATRHAPVGMIGYIGEDSCGADSIEDLRTRGIDVSQIETLPGETSQVLLFIEPSGERTIVGIVDDYLNRITIVASAISAGDLVYFAGWRDEFEPALRQIERAGATIASVPFGRPADALPVSYIIGSRSDLPASPGDVWASYSSWTDGKLKCLVLTRGAEGVELLDSGGCEEVSAAPVNAVDATGAGDAFAAAMLAAILQGRPARSGIDDGLIWGAATVQSEGSIPPPWQDVAGFRPTA